MRTTLDLDVDILTAIKERAQFEGASIGKVASRLIKQALQAKPVVEHPVASAVTERNGFQIVQRKTPPKTPITMARIQAIADAEGI
jgi:hypothetical protein